MCKDSKTVAVFGSTGFVGRQTLDVIKHLGMRVHILSGNKNLTLMEKQIRMFCPKISIMADETAAKNLKKIVKDTNTKVLSGSDELANQEILEDVDIVVNAIVGIAGLKTSIAALATKKTLALANKESFVVAGELLKNIAKKNNVQILPIDSEHSAIFQCLNGNFHYKYIKKIILTASGGPFFGKSKSELRNVSVQDALNHPTWSMGNKITIDSATMMNKGFEIIEAYWFFETDIKKIDVLVHRESIVHSMVEFLDNSIIANLASPDMKLPIQYALTYPVRCPGLTKNLDLSNINKLTFFEPDFNTFEAINICKSSIDKGGTLPAAINGANEAAVNLFLSNKISFLSVTELVKMVYEEYNNVPLNNIEDALLADAWAKDFVLSNYKKYT